MCKGRRPSNFHSRTHDSPHRPARRGEGRGAAPRSFNVKWEGGKLFFQELALKGERWLKGERLVATYPMYIEGRDGLATAYLAQQDGQGARAAAERAAAPPAALPRKHDSTCLSSSYFPPLLLPEVAAR